MCAGLVLAVGLVLLASPLRWKPLPCQRVLIRCCGVFGKIHLILLAFCKWHYIPFVVLCEQRHVYLFSSVAQSCLTLCDPMDCSMPGFPVHHQLLELTQTLVHQATNSIQPLSPSPPAFNLSQHQSFHMSQFFASGGQSIGVSASASVLPMNIQD